MDERDLLKVLRELQVYASPWKSVTQHSISCQTDFDENNNCEYPVIFCSQFSPEFDVQTQCNIPQSPLRCRSCRETVSVENASTQYDITSTSIDYVFRKTDSRFRPITPEGDSYDITTEDTFFEDKDDLHSVREVLFKRNRQPVKFIHDEDNDIKKEPSSAGLNVKSTKIHVTCGLSEDEYGNISDGDVFDAEKEEYMNDDRLSDDEAAHRKKYGEREKGYSSEEEKQFWKEMKKVSMTIRGKRKTRKKCRKYVLSNGDENKSGIFSTQMDKANIGATETENFKVDGNEGDWITDNEVDEDDDLVLDFNEAFREEWKKKRVPAHTHEKNFICEVCKKPYSKKTYLREHIVRDHPDHEIARKFHYVCTDCKRVYDGQKHLDHHRSLYCGPCEICGMMFGCSGQFWIHRKNHDAVCDICNKVCSSVSVLYTHKKMKHGKKKILCELCGKGFVYKFMLKIHIEKSHSWGPDDKPSTCKENTNTQLQDLNCRECAYVAKNEQSLRVHWGMAHKRKQRKSDGEVYCCPICNAELSSKAVLKKHVSRHVGSLPGHKCDYCQRLFATEKKLFSHFKRTHEVNPQDPSTLQEIIGEDNFIQCRSCESVFDSPFALQSHVLSVHSGIPKNIHAKMGQEADLCKCKFCDASFELPDALQTHRLAVHNVPHDMSTEIVQQVTASSLQVTNEAEDLQVMSMNANDRHSILQESGAIQETLEMSVDSSAEAVDSRTTLSLPAYAVPTNVNLVEIDGVQYHVIRSGQ